MILSLKRIFVVLALCISVVMAGTITPAKAHHAGYYVLNHEAMPVDVMIRDHTYGTTYWDYVKSNSYSDRGARGVFVPSNYRIYYQSIQTGARYHSLCPQHYREQGYVWTGKPFMPMPIDRSIIILDVYYSQACYQGY